MYSIPFSRLFPACYNELGHMTDQTTKKELLDRTKWAGAENALAEGTYSGYMLGVIETRKIFAQLLKDKKIPGFTVGKKIKRIRRYLSLPEKMDFSQEIYHRIIEDLNPTITREETKEAIAGYWQAIKDIEETIPQLSFGQKIGLWSKFYLDKVFKFSRQFFIGLAIFVFAVLFLYDTQIGRRIADILGQSAHILIFKIVPWIIGVVLCVIGLVFFWSILKKKRERL